MGLFDYFKTRKKLIAERNYAWQELDRLRLLVNSIDDIKDVRGFINGTKVLDPPRVVATTNPEKLSIQHVGVGVLAESFKDMIKSCPDFTNYLILPVQTDDGKNYEVVFQKEGAMTAHQKAEKLEKELESLKGKTQC